MPALRPVTGSAGIAWTLATHREDDARNAPDDARTVCVEARSAPWLVYLWLPPGWERMPDAELVAALEREVADAVATRTPLDEDAWR